MIVDVIQAAKKDIAEAYHFYERQQKGLGPHFRECILEDLYELETTAGIHRTIRGYYHANSKRFKSILYYRIDGDTATVVAILDGRINLQKRDRILRQR
jgi:hypothetical protein